LRPRSRHVNARRRSAVNRAARGYKGAANSVDPNQANAAVHSQTVSYHEANSATCTGQIDDSNPVTGNANADVDHLSHGFNRCS